MVHKKELYILSPLYPINKNIKDPQFTRKIYNNEFIPIAI